MRVLMCLTYEHNWWLLVLATAICLSGSMVSVKLFQRTLARDTESRFHWAFLSAVIAGSSIWVTHFISMLSYQPSVSYSFDGPLTVLSAVIAVAGSGLGIGLSLIKNRLTASVLGGGTLGLAIAAMHYVGMFAYRADGRVAWLPGYVVASIIFATIFSALMVYALRRLPNKQGARYGVVLFVLAILTLHFTGMAAFEVTPIGGVMQGADSEAFGGMAAAVAMVGALIIGAGISTHIVELRSQSRSEQQLYHLATHDQLTSVANRRSFADKLTRYCERISSEDFKFSLLMIDLDRFKPVNDTPGHPIGDKVLQMVSKRMRCVVREQDFVSRIGGDEFAIIVKRIDEGEAQNMAARLVEVMSRPFVVEGHVVEIGASIGIAMAPSNGTVADTLARNADIALYAAKKAGRNQSSMFDPQLEEIMKQARSLETDLRRACARDDFIVNYQPVVDSLSAEITGAEALLRWHCPLRGLVPPSEFIPIAEELGLISRIGSFVLEKACADAAKWPKPIDIAVNISPIQLADPRLVQTVKEALKNSGLAPERLELEITETALLGDEQIVLEALRKIKKLGVSISLDDFGTGYSSLSYLHRFPISRIKIDRSFVSQLPNDEGSASIINAIAQLGATMNMKITAEGVETQEQYDFVAAKGCNNMQGYLFSKPMQTADLEQLLQENHATLAA